jgi:hypothetical protein
VEPEPEQSRAAEQGRRSAEGKHGLVDGAGDPCKAASESGEAVVPIVGGLMAAANQALVPAVETHRCPTSCQHHTYDARLDGLYGVVEPSPVSQPRRTWFQRAIDWLQGPPAELMVASAVAPTRPHDDELDPQNIKARDRRAHKSARSRRRPDHTDPTGGAMPLIAAVLVVNHRHGTTETHAISLADPLTGRSSRGRSERCCAHSEAGSASTRTRIHRRTRQPTREPQARSDRGGSERRVHAADRGTPEGGRASPDGADPSRVAVPSCTGA